MKTSSSVVSGTATKILGTDRIVDPEFDGAVAHHGSDVRRVLGGREADRHSRMFGSEPADEIRGRLGRKGRKAGKVEVTHRQGTRPRPPLRRPP